MTDTADTKQAKQEIERANAPEKRRTALEVIEGLAPEIERSLQSRGAAEILTRHVYTAYRYSPELQMCSAASLVGALLLTAQVRLEPGPLGHVYLVPFARKGAHEIVWVLGYKGILELARRGGAAGLRSTVVWSDDGWTGIRNVNGKLNYEHAVGEHGPGSERVGVLVEWVYEKAQHAMFWGPEEIDRALKASPRKDQTRRGEDWYWRKTGIRRSAAFMPASTELAQAERADVHIVRSVQSVDLGLEAPVAEAMLEEPREVEQ